MYEEEQMPEEKRSQEGFEHSEDEFVEDEDLDVQETAEYADDKVDALINLLVKKGIITEAEFDAEYDELYEQVEEESSEEQTE